MSSGIYLMDFKEVIKVGFSRDVPTRIKSLSQQFGLKCVSCETWETPFANNIESSIKDKFKSSSIPFNGVVNECFTPDVRVLIKDYILVSLKEKANIKKGMCGDFEYAPLAIYIDEHHNGNTSHFATSQDVSEGQARRWLKRNCVVIDGIVYCEVSKKIKGSE